MQNFGEDLPSAAIRGSVVIRRERIRLVILPVITFDLEFRPMDRVNTPHSKTAVQDVCQMDHCSVGPAKIRDGIIGTINVTDFD